MGLIFLQGPGVDIIKPIFPPANLSPVNLIIRPARRPWKGRETFFFSSLECVTDSLAAWGRGAVLPGIGVLEGPVAFTQINIFQTRT